MTRRYILKVTTLVLADSATEYWYGIEAGEGADLSAFADDLIPAEGMTDDELAVVTKWIKVP